MRKLIGERTGGHLVRAGALAATIGILAPTAAGCSSSAKPEVTVTASPSEHELSVLAREQAELRALGHNCLRLPPDKVFKTLTLGAHKTEIEFQDGPVPPDKDERTCTVTLSSVAGHLVVSKVSFDTAEGVRSTLAEHFAYGHPTGLTAIIDGSAAGLPVNFSEVGPYSLDGGADYAAAVKNMTRELADATPVAGA